MGYRSERFDVGELSGLGKVFETIDGLEVAGLGIETEVMSGSSYRRQLHESTVSAGYDANYLLQVTLDLPKVEEGKRYKAGYYVEESRRVLGELVLPGEVSLDPGALIQNLAEANQPFGAPKSEDNIVGIIPPWVKAAWSESGKSCLLFCGILPPKPKGFWEDHYFNWDERIMRKGILVFRSTPHRLLEPTS